MLALEVVLHLSAMAAIVTLMSTRYGITQHDCIEALAH